MSRFDYKKAPVMSRIETIQVTPKEDFLDILINNDLNRVQKVIAIREAVRDSYRSDGYRDVVVRFVDGVIENLIDSNKLEGRPLPDTILFDVELFMPIVEVSTVPVGFKSDWKNKFAEQEPTYFNDEWNQYDPTGDYHDAI